MVAINLHHISEIYLVHTHTHTLMHMYTNASYRKGYVIWMTVMLQQLQQPLMRRVRNNYAKNRTFYHTHTHMYIYKFKRHCSTLRYRRTSSGNLSANDISANALSCLIHASLRCIFGEFKDFSALVVIARRENSTQLQLFTFIFWVWIFHSWVNEWSKRFFKLLSRVAKLYASQQIWFLSFINIGIFPLIILSSELNHIADSLSVFWAKSENLCR